MSYVSSAESRAFRLEVDSCYGVGYLVRKADSFVTLLFTCSEGWEDIVSLRRARRAGAAIFDSVCAEYSFSDPEAVS